jgi:hypothetical protein
MTDFIRYKNVLIGEDGRSPILTSARSARCQEGELPTARRGSDHSIAHGHLCRECHRQEFSDGQQSQHS